jgi:hypothetical protein
MQKGFSLDQTIQQIERSYVEAALALTNGNLSQAAKLLGVHRTTLYSRMQNYMSQSIDFQPQRALMYYAFFGLSRRPSRSHRTPTSSSKAATGARYWKH